MTKLNPASHQLQIETKHHRFKSNLEQYPYRLHSEAQRATWFRGESVTVEHPDVGISLFT